MLSNVKMRQLIGLGYALPITLFFVIAGLIGSTSLKVSESFQKINRAENAIIEADKMTISLLLMVRDFRGYLLFDRENLIESVETQWKEFKKVSDKAELLVETPEQQERLKQMIQRGNWWKNEFATEVIKLGKQGKKKEGFAIVLSGKGINWVTEFDQLNKEFTKQALQELTTLQKEATNALNNLVFLGISTALFSVIVAIFSAYWIGSNAARKIIEQTEKIAGSATEIAVTVMQQERSTNNQASAVNETTTTVDEIGVSAQQTSQQTEAAVAEARQALALAKGGNKAVDKTLEGMDILKEKVRLIAEQIMNLSEQTNQIGTISSLVSELANQTNMLAINASVEAVRAGENGKGFAVVASEIRKLADMSKKSASQINLLVNNTQKAIHSTVIVTEEGTKTVAEGVRIAQSTSDAFQGVTDAINNVVINNQQIALNIKQQAMAIQQVVEAMNAINTAAKENSQGIIQVKEGVQRLNDAAHNLNEIV
jgi:methyl-accepting chemotaxis protein